MKILTVKLLEEIISNKEFSKIKMKTKTICDGYTSTEDTELFEDGNFIIERSKDYERIYLEWSSYEGGPEISLNNENTPINFISDNCDGSYKYLLYID
jgi:hypothetical protein